MRQLRPLAWLAAVLGLAALAFLAIGYWNATAAPIVRRLTIRVPEYPVGAAPVKIALFSDLHVHGPDMPPSRVRRIVHQINALHPDIDIAAGDFLGDTWIGRSYPVGEAIAPLSELKAPLGVYAVLGNNDYEAGEAEIVAALAKAGVRVLENSQARAGPLALAGMEGRYHIRALALKAERKRTYDALAAMPGAKVLIAHRPDEFVPAPASVALVLAGHTHCGQIVLPFIGPVETGLDYGRKYLCGVVRDGSKTLVVTGGLGTSHLPLRIGAPSDIWLIATSSSPRSC